MIPHPRLAGLCFLVAICQVSSLQAADEKVFTQKPIVAPAKVAGEVAVPTPKEPQLFNQGPVPLWIWGADINRRYFLKKEFPGGSTAARLKTTCDNHVTVFINGKEVVHSDTWQTPVEVDVQKFLKPDNNVLLAEVVNDSGPAGLVLKLAMTMPKNEMRYIVSDESWQAAEKKDADKWVPVKKIAKLGDAPWGNVFSQAAAAGSALPANTFQVLPGFQVERLFTVPKDKLGSWVSICFDDKGRLIASDQDNKALCRITPT